MSLKEQVQKLPQVLQENLNQLVENTLIEKGFMKDPYEMTDEQRQLLDKKLMDEDEKETAPGTDTVEGETALDFAEENYEAYNVGELPASLIEAIYASNNADELFAIYKITQQAVANEEAQYDSTMDMSKEFWDKLKS